jgi:hypothetical protein
VGPKDAGHLTIKVGELAVELEHGLGESHDEGGGGCLAGHVSGLLAGGFDGGVGKLACAADSAPLQPSRQPSGTQLADRCRGLKPLMRISGPWLVKSSTRSRAGKMPVRRARSRLMLRVRSAARSAR